MKLTYRGRIYDSDFPTVDATEGEVGGKYRGQKWNYRYPRHIPVSRPPLHLKYRGQPLIKTATPTAASLAVEQFSEKLAQTPLPPADNLRCKNNIGPIHQANLCRILDRRKQAAIQRGDEELLKQLEDESQYLVCC